MLNNLIPTTCQVCASKLQVENKVFFSALGGVGGGVEAGFGVLLLVLFFQTGNIVYLGLLGVSFVALLLAVTWLLFRFVKLKVELPYHA